MKTSTKVPSQYGPLEVELLECEQCGDKAQTAYAVGWVQVFRVGGMATLAGKLWDEHHFCSPEHLTEYMNS